MDLENCISMLPGPVKMHPRVIRAMQRPSYAHRSEEFHAVNKEIKELLQYLFQSENDVCILTGSGTAAMEAGISSVINREDKILCVSNGKFGERLCEISKLYGNATCLSFDWGKNIEVEKVKEQLEKEEYKALVLCHNETSTGMVNPAPELSKFAKKQGCLFILDGITSVGAIPVKPEEWGIDILVMGSQKCLAAPPGLSALCISENAKEHLVENNYYLSLKKYLKSMERNDTPYTPAIPLFFAFREALRMVKEEGLENRIAKTKKLANACRSAVWALGLELFPTTNYSNTLTAINYPEGISDEFREKLRNDYEIIVAGGQGHLKGRVFRIGHMGICTINDLSATFGAIEGVLKELNWHAKGSGVEAILEFAGTTLSRK